MKFLLITINILIMSAFLSQNSAVHIKKKDFEGFIFNENVFALKSIYNQKKRYSPSVQDITIAEEILKSKLSKINNPLINQDNGCPIIHKNLKKYIRQYVGFIDNNDDNIIWINFLWSNKIDKCDAGKDILFVLDGCSYFWSIEVNITSKLLLELKINGRG